MRQPELIGQPLPCSIYLDDRYAWHNGCLRLYTTASGCPCVFNVYNITDDRLEESHPLPGGRHCWSHGVDAAGRVYIAPQDGARLFRYTPGVPGVTDLGDICGQTAAYQPSFDEQGNVYMGTFPDGLVVKYDVREGRFHSYGPAAEGQGYVHSLFYYRGHIYAGTSAAGAKFIRIDAKTGDRREIPLPGDLRPERVENLYSMSRVDTLAFLYVFYGQQRLLLIYDLEAGCWVDHRVEDYGGLFVSPPVNGRIYFSAGGAFREFDPLSRSSRDTGLPAPANGKGFASARFPGETREKLVTLDHAGLILKIVDFEAKTIEERPLQGRLRAGLLSMTVMEPGPGGELYIGAFMGSRGAALNTGTGGTRLFRLDQAEGMARMGDEMFFGVYPGGRIYRYHPAEQSDPGLALVIGEEQDRPFALAPDESEKILYIGTVPGYTKLGGAITRYAPATGEKKVYRNLIPGHSVVSLLCRGGLVYGSTSIWGGLGIPPSEERALLFVWDPVSGRVLRRASPVLPELKGCPDRIGGLVFGPDGLLWCAGRTEDASALFAVRPETLEVVKSAVFRPREPLSRWRPTSLHWGQDGALYSNLAGLVATDPETLRSRLLAEGDVPQMTLADDGRLYFGEGPSLYRLDIP